MEENFFADNLLLLLLIVLVSIAILWFLIKTAVKSAVSDIKRDIAFLASLKELELKKAGLEDDIKRLKEIEACITDLNRQKRLGYIDDKEYQKKMKLIQK